MRQKTLKRKRTFVQSFPLLAIALPGLVYLFMNNYIPMAGIFIAFKKINYAKGIFKSPWCGLENFKFLFQSNSTFIMLRNTVLYNLLFIFLGTILAVALAIFMSEISRSRMSKFFQAGLVLPNLISMVIVSYMVYAFLNPENGLINNSVLKSMGINWYSEAKYWPYILTIVFIWKNVGYTSIVYIASIAGIDPGLYEAARIDGAGKFKQIFMITIPQIRSTIVIMVLLAIGRIFTSDFGLFYQVPMNSGALTNTTQTIDTYVYRALTQMNNIGMASAAGLFQSIVGFVLVLTANFVVRRIEPDNSLF
jgi:putative aldouronate transport system permease protein